MLYFSKIATNRGHYVFNLDRIMYISYFNDTRHDRREGEVVEGEAYAEVYFEAQLSSVILNKQEYNQLVQDIDTAMMLVKLQRESKE
jgi:hypothetical protein